MKTMIVEQKQMDNSTEVRLSNTSVIKLKRKYRCNGEETASERQAVSNIINW